MGPPVSPLSPKTPVKRQGPGRGQLMEPKALYLHLGCSGLGEGKSSTFASALPESPRFRGETWVTSIKKMGSEQTEHVKWPPQSGLLSCFLPFALLSLST